ncbi:hypothetical protein H009_21371 [Agrobacterium tumefaciens str. Cherry 2E-2-2]|nr:hypothetical protein H009_21371 [Agrobacterium tumefaciens str. Cherry 2E-2-2]
MKKAGTLGWFYRLANTLILGGFAMLCQPFTHDLFVVGFPVLLSGVILFMVLDHVPDNLTSSGQS